MATELACQREVETKLLLAAVHPNAPSRSVMKPSTEVPIE
jgi:hypothetical protein